MRDRHLFNPRAMLQVPVRRVDCLTCGRVTERIACLEPASGLTRRLRVWFESFLASANMHTSILGRVNNQIKVIKRMTYNFRDSDYFFLNIKTAFRGRAR